jgi:nicotinamide-nucleotide amidase
MTIAFLATGDEIIQGDTLNTNVKELAHAIHSEGLSVGRQTVCTDMETDIYDCIAFLAKNHDILIITGGLGPTSDDRTRFALARFMGITLKESPEALAHIQKLVLRHNSTMNKGNRQQALFPETAILLANSFGTAMGAICKHKQKTFILLPGPPAECLPMFNSYVLPFLQKSLQSMDQKILKWRLFAVSEGQIAEKMDEALKNLDCETGYRLEMPYLEFKVRCKPTLEKEVREIIEPLIKPYIIATVEQRASEKLVTELISRNIQISIDDEATGGLLQTLIQKPHSYDLIKFAKPSSFCNYYLPSSRGLSLRDGHKM